VGCVYCLTSPSGRSYIGLSTDFDSRMVEHLSMANSGSRYLIHKAIRKYGWDSFTRRVLFESSDVEELKAKEQELIAQHRTFFREGGYNMTRGGDGVFGLRFTDESRLRMSKAHKGKRLSATTRKKIADAHRGRPKSKEHRRNISKAIMGHPSYKKSGKPCSEETRDKIRSAMLGKTYPNRKPPPSFSAEHRARLREGQRRRREREKARREACAA
jgi:group I intron endonuclease